jgi:hypothetical protein
VLPDGRVFGGTFVVMKRVGGGGLEGRRIVFLRGRGDTVFGALPAGSRPNAGAAEWR